MTATTTRPLDYDEQTRREADLRDWKQAIRRYQARTDAGEVLDTEELTDYMYCLDRRNHAYLVEAGLV